MGDLNGHHQEWPGSMTTNQHGGAAFDFATVSGCNRWVVGPTHAHDGTLVFLEHRVNWNTVCGSVRDLPWLNIWLVGNPLEGLNFDSWTFFTN